MKKVLAFLKKPLSSFYKIIFILWTIELSVLFLIHTLTNISSVTFTVILIIISMAFYTRYEYYANIASRIALFVFWIASGWTTIVFISYDLYQFSMGHELYLNSPATILIVYILAIVTLPFPTLLLFSLIIFEIFTVTRNERIRCWVYFKKIQIEKVINFLILMIVFLFSLNIFHNIVNNIYVTLISMLILFILSGYFVESVSSVYVIKIFKNIRCKKIEE